MIFFILEREIQYLENQKICVFGTYFDIRRKHAGYGDEGIQYRYSGLKLNAKTWTPLLIAIRDSVSEITKDNYNFVLINRFECGDQCLGFFADEWRDVDHNTGTVYISLGRTRDMIFRNKGYVTNQSFTLKLENGFMTRSCPPTNECYTTGIPQKRAFPDPFICLAFKKVNTRSQLKRVTSKYRLLPSTGAGSCCSAI